MWLTRNSRWRKILQPPSIALLSRWLPGEQDGLPANVVGDVAGWSDFVDELEAKVLPIYERHERTFDGGGVHGRMHICRSVLFAEFMARFYQGRLSLDLDYFAIRTATAFHDSGRQANGVDLWETDSSHNCHDYVMKIRGSEEVGYPEYVSGLIDKRRARDTLAGWIVYDADVLEIMRPCCGHGGLKGFRRECLHFAGPRDVLVSDVPGSAELREAFISESWRWIAQTEKLKPRLLRSRTYFLDLLDFLDNSRRKFPLIAPLVEC